MFVNTAQFCPICTVFLGGREANLHSFKTNLAIFVNILMLSKIGLLYTAAWESNEIVHTLHMKF